MSVENAITLNQYIAVANQTVFDYTFEIQDQANVMVYQTPFGNAPNDVLDLLVLTTDYTVTGVGATGGTVVLVTPAGINDIITLSSGVPPARSTAFTPGGLIKADNLNDEFDNLVLILQRIITYLLEKTPLFMESAVVPAWNLELPILGPNEAWVSNSTGTAIIATPLVITVDGNLPWVDVSSNTQLMSSNTGYGVDNGATLVTFTLPTTSVAGDLIIIAGHSAGGWKLIQGTGQQIFIDQVNTTLSTGYIASTLAGDTIHLRCTIANTIWQSDAIIGNITYV